MSQSIMSSKSETKFDKYSFVDITSHTDGSTSWSVRSSGHTFSEAFSERKAIDRIILNSGEMYKSIQIVHDHVVTDIGEMIANADHHAWYEWDDDKDICISPTIDGHACGSCANCYDFLNRWEIQHILDDVAAVRIPNKNMSYDDMYSLADSFKFIDVVDNDPNYPNKLRATALLEADYILYEVIMSRDDNKAIADDKDNTSWNIISVDGAISNNRI